jgi:hypothetical protein
MGYRRNKGDCKICSEEGPVLGAVAGAIWDEKRRRVSNYRAAALRVLEQHGLYASLPTISKHADHVERAWAITAELDAEAVHSSDFRSVTGRFIAISHEALTALQASIRAGLVSDADLTKIASLGLSAAKMRQIAEQVSLGGLLGLPAELAALFGGVSGHLRPGDISEYEGMFKDVTPHPIEEMRNEMAAEGAKLKALQAGTP